MAESLGSAVLTLTTDDRGLDAGLARGEAKAEAAADRFTRIGGKMKDVGTNLSVAMTLPIGAFAVASFNAASDAAELQSAFDVTFGSMSADMNEWARTTGDAMGRSTQEMQGAANTFGMFFNQAAPTKQAAADMSKQFTILAQDLSSFYNVDPGEALAKLRSGLSGETEPLRDFGVFITDAAMGAKALEMGLGGSTKELTEQQKIMVRAALIMDATTKAQGDVERTSAGTANQVRAAKAAWDELQVSVGTRLLPIFTPLITGLSSVLNNLTGLPAPVQTVIMVVAGLAAAAGPLLIGLGLMSSGIGTLIPILTGMGTAFTVVRTAALTTLPALTPFLLPLAALAAAVGAVYLAWQNWGAIEAILASAWAAISGWWTGNVQPVLTAVGDAVERVVGVFTDGFGAQLRRVVEGVSALLRGDFAGAWRAAVGFVTAPARAMLDAIEALVPGATGAMQRMYTGVREWLQTRLGAVFEWVNGRVQAVGDKFKWLWDVVVGHSYVPDLVDGIGYEFARLNGVMVKPAEEAADKVAGAMAGIAVPPIGAGDWGVIVGESQSTPSLMPEETEADWRQGFTRSLQEGVKAAMDGDLGGFFQRWLQGNTTRALDNAFKALADLLPGGSGSGIGGLLSSLFAGGFATGGLIPSGKFGIVGERGPELAIASPSGALIRPNASLSGASLMPGSAGLSVSIPISIDATGADAAALERVRTEVAQLRRDLPGTIVRTVQDAGERRIINPGTWR